MLICHSSNRKGIHQTSNQSHCMFFGDQCYKGEKKAKHGKGRRKSEGGDFMEVSLESHNKEYMLW